MPIHVLPPTVAAKIAAGEVIERPSSVVKELVENALDAGATEVTVEIAEGGVRLIRVRDNGCGLEPEDVPLAFQRHATSKILQAEDLLSIATLGFRGEALPSIAAVADVTLLTRPRMALGGYFFHTQGEQVLAEGARGAPAGTVVTVRDLFGHYPARRQFLRSSSAEAAQCTTVVSHYVLARPSVRFTLTVDGKRTLHSPGSGDSRDAAAAVLGSGISRDLLEIAPAEGQETPDESAYNPVQVAGLVSPPGVTRATRGYISIFVNGRWVQNRSIAFAVEEAYQGVLMTGRHPVAIVHLAIPRDLVDVNVHPRKLEVRFRREQEVFTAVQRAVRRALTGAHPLAMQSYAQAATAPENSAVLIHQPSLDPSFLGGSSELPSPSGQALPGPRVPVLRVMGQLSSTYIIAEGPTGMYLVDQHAAHERVVFEQTTDRLERQGLEQQLLLEPKVIEMAAGEVEILLSEEPELGWYGFHFEAFGAQQLLVRALPAGMRERDLRQVLEELVAPLQTRERLPERLATTIACHSAVRAGDALTLEAMRHLLQALEQCRAPNTCPHGRPTMMHLSAAQLERAFGRRG